jgi:hypothetical protein
MSGRTIWRFVELEIWRLVWGTRIGQTAAVGSAEGDSPIFAGTKIGTVPGAVEFFEVGGQPCVHSGRWGFEVVRQMLSRPVEEFCCAHACFASTCPAVLRGSGILEVLEEFLDRLEGETGVEGAFADGGHGRSEVRGQGSGVRGQGSGVRGRGTGAEARRFFDRGGDFSSFSIPFDGRKMGAEADGEE